MNRKKDILFKEFTKNMTDEDVNYFCFLLDERKSGDQGEMIEFLQKDPEMDWVLSAAKDSNEFYDLIDEINEYLERESRRRFVR